MKIDNQEYKILLKGNTYHCALDVTMDYVGGKWKTVVLWYLRNESKRFTELTKLIPQMTERMLSITLKQLTDDGLIKRQVFSKKPPLKVEYSLTEFGESLMPVVTAIAKWGRELAKAEGEVVPV
jgi:DNA-binding HxlR family transcriptional regulator